MTTRTYYVYIATNRRGTLYTGVTNDAEARITQHRDGASAFTSSYRVGKLIYAEATDNVWDALAREKQIKGWTRAKKLALTRTMKPSLRDLSVAGYYWWHAVAQRRASGASQDGSPLARSRR